jgi:hypothetical protein
MKTTTTRKNVEDKENNTYNMRGMKMAATTMDSSS